jgi:hypothetical protein
MTAWTRFNAYGVRSRLGDDLNKIIPYRMACSYAQLWTKRHPPIIMKNPG